MLINGTRLGPYEITGQLGAGGMGEVYRARDSRLDRTVAIKVLSQGLSSNAGLRERFDREAKAISSLTHPHICTLYDVGSHEGTDYIVMEYLEGESLAERLVRGALPIDQVLRYGVEIAEALEKAHRSNIVHRDLKPGNVILTRSGAKLLDFGLAKFTKTPSPLSDPNAATAALSHGKPLTEEGSILGTFQYMAPEQIEGQDADSRTDIFALGTLLYEMATGKRAFEARSRASLIASILDRDPPPISAVQPLTPPALERVVKMCLAKDPDDRWQSAHDIAAELRWIRDSSAAETPGPGARRHVRRGWIRNAALLLAGLILGGVAAWMLSRGDRHEPIVTRTSIRTPAAAPLFLVRATLAISPDGRYAVYRGRSSGKAHLFLRPLDRLNAVAIAGTDGGQSPVFSPDGRWIAFEANGAIFKVARTGGARIKLGDSPGGGLGLAWSGEKIYATRAFAGGVWELTADGSGQARVVIETNPAKELRAIVWPDVLPGGETILATVWNAGSWDDARIMAFSLKDGSSRVVLRGGHFARYSPTGHLLYMRAGNLMAVSFDPTTLEAGASPSVLVHGVAYGSSDGEAHFASSEAGHLLYVAGGDSVPLSTLVWLDRQGGRTPIVPTPRRYGSVALMPDQRGAIVTIESFTYDVWHLDFERDSLTRISHGGDDSDGIVTPDGNRVIWSSSRSGVYNLFWRGTDGSSAEEVLAPSSDYQERPAVTPDGKAVIFSQFGRTSDLWLLPLNTSKPQQLLATAFNETDPAISPNGQWLAYSSDEAGRAEVYVTSFPTPAGKWQVSTTGGRAPQWTPDGRELTYLKDNELFLVPVETTPRPRAGRPVLLSKGNFDDEYSIASDGRIALILAEDQRTATEIQLVLNWPREVARQSAIR